MKAGFDSRFLPRHEVELPQLATDAARADLRRTRSGEAVRHCTHFSLSMSTSRRFCRWVAWNIDGKNHVPTTGDTRDFKDDPEYDESAQIDDDLYIKNDLDQGHIAAFADVSWGTTDEAALGSGGVVLLHQHHAAAGHVQPLDPQGCVGRSRALDR
jgi:endonuclease G, mitochondrial